MQQSCKECFQALGCFDYNAANKLVNKAIKLSSGAGSVFAALTKCESTYTSLEFLKSKLFRKDDFLVIQYIETVKEIQNAVKTLKISPNGTDPLDVEYFIDLCEGLQEFMVIRQAQIHIFRTIQNAFTDPKNDSIVKEIESLRERVNTYQLKKKMGPLGIGVEHELVMFHDLLMAHNAIVNYNFKDATIFMYTARMELNTWRELCSNQSYSEKSTNKLEETSKGFAWHNFFSTNPEKQSKGGKRDASPNYMQWLKKFHSNLTANMTLYFMNVLLDREQIMGGDLRSLWKKIDKIDAEDYHGLIRSFRKKSGAHSVALIYEVTDDIKFHQQGYVCAGVPYEKPTGKNSFPFIYCYPKDLPKEHWPNIISIMQSHDPTKSTPFYRNIPIHFYDKGFGSTYYMIRVDAHVGLVIIYMDKHATPDTAASEFIMSLANRLSGLDISQSLQKFND
ncbi:9574_t:CDS:2 [Ambispora gerdemannii]|uniref:9574_t:CDS:1 n=1 Tax=Ambispora gerdemannii TaxID=144530 RepID=A0A9N8ZI37_9GLOM|nr:9574_t:CDS:2 [Ambispora gerdemannii]